MSFGTAVSTCFRKYVDFSGRARRKEYWYWFLFTLLLGLVASTIDNMLGFGVGQMRFNDAGEMTNPRASMQPVQGLVSLITLLPTLAVTARRLHDTGRSGWLQLIGLIPIIGWIMMIIWMVKDSDPGTNQHGPNPKGVGDMGQYGYGQPGYGQPGAPGQQGFYGQS